MNIYVYRSAAIECGRGAERLGGLRFVEFKIKLAVIEFHLAFQLPGSRIVRGEKANVDALDIEVVERDFIQYLSRGGKCSW